MRPARRQAHDRSEPDRLVAATGVWQQGADELGGVREKVGDPLHRVLGQWLRPAQVFGGAEPWLRGDAADQRAEALQQRTHRRALGLTAEALGRRVLKVVRLVHDQVLEVG